MQQAHTFHDIRADIYKPTSQRSNLTAKMKDMTASGRIIKQGFLTKQALKSKRNWKQRWCVLQVRMCEAMLLYLSPALVELQPDAVEELRAQLATRGDAA